MEERGTPVIAPELADHPLALPLSINASLPGYTGLGLNPQIARWAGKRSFVSIINKNVPVESQMRIRGDGGVMNASLVREWHQREAAEAALQAHTRAKAKSGWLLSGCVE